jgi:hypothetical protein
MKDSFFNSTEDIKLVERSEARMQRKQCFIKSQRGTYPQYSAQVAWSDEVNEMLGVPKGEGLPTDGMEPREIQGIKVWVNPLPPIVPGKRRRFALRVRCNCPVCGREMPVGRLRQHSRVHQESNA